MPDKSTVDHLFHGFTDATCQSNGVIICRIGSLQGMTIAFLQSEGKSPEVQILKIFKGRSRKDFGKCLSSW